MTSKTIMIALGLALCVMGFCNAQSVNPTPTTATDSTRNEATAARLSAVHARQNTAPQATVAGGTASAVDKTQTPQTAVANNPTANSSSRRLAYLEEVRSQAAAKRIQDSIAAANRNSANKNVKVTPNAPSAPAENGTPQKIVLKRIGGASPTPASAGSKAAVNPASNKN